MKIIIVGAGINGATAAVVLAQRGHRVTLLDPGPIPHPLAASTDISKVIRMEYGADADYMELAERSLRGWHTWNREFGADLFHPTGVLFLCQEKMKRGAFEGDSYALLQKRKHQPQRLTSAEIKKRFPAWNARRFVDGVFNPEGGFAESGRVVMQLVDKANLKQTLSSPADAPIVYRRVCLYSDTWDGHFWIDHDPEHPGLVVAAGDSGHGFKFAPALGDLIADCVEEKQNAWLKKFRWRPEVKPPRTEEAARHVEV